MMKSLFTSVLFLFSISLFSQDYEMEKHWWQPEGTIYSVVVDDSNDLVYLGGNFSSVSPYKAYGAQIDTSGVLDLNTDDFNGQVKTVIPDLQGGWYVGGTFSKVGNQTRYNIAHLDSSGNLLGSFSELGFDINVEQLDLRNDTLIVCGGFSSVGKMISYGTVFSNSNNQPDYTYPEPNNLVICSVPDGTGGWFIGGEFTKVGNQLRNHLAHIDSSGNLTSWNPSIGGRVNTMFLDGTSLYIAGYFTHVDGVDRNKAAAVDITTGALLPWNPNPSGQINAMVKEGNNLIIGGSFYSVSGQNIKHLAQVNATTGVPTTWNNSLGIYDQIRTLTKAGNTLIVGGDFSTIAGQARNNIAAFNLNTMALTAWNPNANNSVRSVDTYNDKVYLAGTFSTIGGQSRNNFAEVDLTSGLVDSWNPMPSTGEVTLVRVWGNSLIISGSYDNIGGSQRKNLASFNILNDSLEAWSPITSISSLSLTVNGNNIYIGGTGKYGGEVRNNLAAIDIIGDTITSWNPNVSGNVSNFKIDGNKIYIGGIFDSVDLVERNNLARIDLTTGIADAWNPNVNNKVNSIDLKGDTVMIGGSFSSVGGTNRYRLAAINALTGVPTSWTCYTPSIITRLEVVGNDMYVAGSFTTIGGQPRNRLAKINLTTGNTLAWDPNVNGAVYDFLLDNNKMFVVGNFTAIGGQPRDRVAAISLTTGLPNSFNPIVSSFTNCINIQGSRMFIGGFFTTVGKITRNNVCALNATTGALTPWNPNSNGYVSRMELYGNTMYLGGNFDTIGGSDLYRLAAINTSTGLANSWNANLSNFASISDLIVIGNQLYVSGSFTQIGGSNRNNLAAIDTSTALASSWNPNVNAYIQDMDISGSNVYIGGQFTAVGALTRNRIAAISLSTGIATSFNPNVDNTVFQLANNGTELIIGGRFTTIGASSRNYLAAINMTTGIATSWNPNPTLAIESMTLSDSLLYVAGPFTAIGVYSRAKIATVNTNTGAATNWNPGVNNHINSFRIMGNKILMGGDYTNIDGTDRKYFSVFTPLVCEDQYAPDQIITCASSYTWIDGITYTSNNDTAIHIIPNAVGDCDSIIELDLQFITNYTTIINETACDSFTWNGITYTASTNLPTDTLITSTGCDSILNLNLVINYPNFQTDTIITCDSVTWINGVTYYASNYIDTVTLISSTGCDSIVSLDLTILTIGSSVVQNADTLMAVESGLSYQWIDCATNLMVNGATSQTYIPTVTGSYKVELSNGTCVDTSACFQVNVCDNQAEYSFVDNGTGNFDFTDISLGTYTQVHWAYGDGTTSTAINPNHMYEINGNYVVVLTINDSNASSSCSSYYMDTLNVSGAFSPLVCQAGFSVYYDSVNSSVNVVNSSVGSNLTYLWNFGDGATSTQQYPTHTYATNGPFNLCLTIDNGNGCSGTYCDSISNTGVWFKAAGFTLSVEGSDPNGIVNIELSNNINIYPNPVHNQFNIEITDWPTNLVNIVIRDITGKTIFTKEVKPVSNSETISINTSKWAKGTFFIEMSDGVNRVVEKIIVQ